MNRYKGNQQQPGFQIEMLIDCSDNSINICEMKFYATEFEVSKKKPMNCVGEENFLERKHNQKNI